MAGFWKNLGMSRECLSFETGTPKVDAAVVCHEARCLDLQEREKVCVSFRNLAKKGSEELVAVGEVAQLSGVQVDSTVLVTIFATSEDGPMAASGEKRPLGEVRIPLHRLITRCDGALYYTWLTLDTASLQDTASSITSLIAGGDAEAFDRATLNGPRQLAQPKACISICKTTALDSSGRLSFVADASSDARIAYWGPVLRSQQQHMVMCATHHLEATRRQQQSPTASDGALADRLAKAVSRAQALEDRDAEHLSEIARLRADAANHRDRESKQLNDIQRLEAEVLRLGQSAMQAPDARQEAVLDAQAAEIAQLREALARQEQEQQGAQEAEHLRTELSTMSAEANAKIDAANERIRSLRRDRDEALREAERLAGETRQLSQERNALRLEKETLVEQKEALLKIVEDLHQTCVSAGHEGLHGLTTRASIDSLTGLRLS